MLHLVERTHDVRLAALQRRQRDVELQRRRGIVGLIRGLLEAADHVVVETEVRIDFYVALAERPREEGVRRAQRLVLQRRLKRQLKRQLGVSVEATHLQVLVHRVVLCAVLGEVEAALHEVEPTLCDDGGGTSMFGLAC